MGPELLWYGNGEAYDGGMSAQHIPQMSLAEFLEREEQAECKSEFWNGQMLAMAGGSYEHGLVLNNIGGELRGLLKGSGCKVTGSEVLVQSAPGGYIAYPDVMVHCGPPRFATEKHRVLTNPVLIVEVLSPSTERRDRGVKWIEYRRSETLRQYLLVEVETAHVELYTKGENGIWYLREWRGLDAICDLESIGCRLPLAEIYADVHFE